MSDIKSYIILNKKTSFIIKLFIIISIMIFVTLIIISQIKYTKYLKINGYVLENDNKYQLSLYLSPYELKIINNTNKLIIDKIEYEYKIDYVAKDYVILNNRNYINVVLNINLSKKDKIVNNILNLEIKESNKKLFYYIKDYVMKEKDNEEGKWWRIKKSRRWRI